MQYIYVITFVDLNKFGEVTGFGYINGERTFEEARMALELSMMPEDQITFEVDDFLKPTKSMIKACVYYCETKTRLGGTTKYKIERVIKTNE